MDEGIDSPSSEERERDELNDLVENSVRSVFVSLSLSVLSEYQFMLLTLIQFFSLSEGT